MKAIILAAGRGSRMESVTEDKPKCMTHIGGKPLINWQLDVLKNAGIEDISIVVGYKSEKIVLENVKYFKNNRWHSTSVISSLLNAREWLESEDCIILYSDILYTSNTIKMISNSKEDISITYNVNFFDLWSQRFKNPLEDLETFKVDNKYRVLEIGKRAEKIDDIQGQFMGIVKLSKKGFEKILNVLDKMDSEYVDKLDMTGLLSELLHLGIKIQGIPCNDFWIEMDNKNDMELYESWGEQININKLINTN